jgi:hypothetical protein
MLFRALNDQSVISAFIKVSGYAYGPILGLFVFGMSTKRKIRDKWIPFLCLITPVLAYIIDRNAGLWFGYTFNYETIVINGLLTFLGLLLLSSFSFRKNVGP